MRTGAELWPDFSRLVSDGTIKVINMSISAEYASQYGILEKAEAYRLMGANEKAYAIFDQARIKLESEIQKYPTSIRFGRLSRAYAGLGQRADAIKILNKLTPELSNKDVYGNWIARASHDVARAQTLLGNYNAAIDQLEYILTVTSFWSVECIKLEPWWDPLRDHPRFQKLVKAKK